MEEEIVRSVVEMSAYVFERGLVSGKAGNVSARFKGENGDIVAITPTLKSLADLKEEDIVLVNENGEVLTKGKPSSEVGMHLAIYREKPDVYGIAHTHSPYATGFGFSNKKIKRLEGFGAIKSEYLKEKTEAYIENNLKTATVNELAKVLGYSAVYTGSLVKKLTGCQFSKLLKNKRCEVAAKMLLESDLPVEIVISEVGYENASFFRKAFKEKYGKNPLEFKKGEKNI